MKKILLLVIFIFTFYFVISNVFASTITIPDDAIRIRVVPNSNSKYDQEVKQKVKDQLQVKMYQLLKDAKDISEARKIIEKNLNMIDRELDDILKNEDYSFDINFGSNYFPEKKYKGVTYEEGYYESLLVTLGKGQGDNWWCVLFPPLCLIEAEESTDVEYKSFVKEMIDKYFK